jgi:Ser/Thr protein kinase RdoA (MazF antagonist)
VVAKCASKDTISVEHRVLTWLEAAPFPTVLACGTTDARQTGRAWLVSEYAGGEPYDRRSPTHRRLAGDWMGELHLWCASVVKPDLPSRDSTYHQNVVDEACATLADALHEGCGLTAEHRATVGALEEIGRDVLDRWSELHALLRDIPQTLVHSGIAGKNVRVVQGAGTPAVLAFDWEQAGWGCPVADMSMVDLNSYRKRARQGGVDLPDSALVQAVGELLWCFAAIPGERPNLLGSWPHRAVGKLEAYLDRVGACLLVLDAGTRSRRRLAHGAGAGR